MYCCTGPGHLFGQCMICKLKLPEFAGQASTRYCSAPAAPGHSPQKDAPPSIVTAAIQQSRPHAAIAPEQKRSQEAHSLSGSTAPSASLGNAEGSECVVCWEAAANVVLVPCGHMCACSGCAALLQQSDCPMCRCKVQACLCVEL